MLEKAWIWQERDMLKGVYNKGLARPAAVSAAGCDHWWRHIGAAMGHALAERRTPHFILEQADADDRRLR